MNALIINDSGHCLQAMPVVFFATFQFSILCDNKAMQNADGNSMPFAGMKVEQKEVRYLAAEAKVLNEKIAQVPALKNYIKEESYRK